MSEVSFWVIQLPGWLLFTYLLIAQCTAAVSYAFGVRMGTQEPAEAVTEVGTAFWKGFAGADLVFYTPLLGLGLIGHLYGTAWANVVLSAACGISIYWPIVCLWSIRAARNAPGWHLPKERQYWIVLPLIALWGSIGLLALFPT